MQMSFQFLQSVLQRLEPRGFDVTDYFGVSTFLHIVCFGDAETIFTAIQKGAKVMNKCHVQTKVRNKSTTITTNTLLPIQVAIRTQKEKQYLDAIGRCNLQNLIKSIIMNGDDSAEFIHLHLILACRWNKPRLVKNLLEEVSRQSPDHLERVPDEMGQM